MKVCTRCGKNKDNSEFHKNKKMKDGLQYYCRVCITEYGREWVAKNKEKRRLYLQEYCFLYGRHGKDRDRGGYLDGQGFCIWCGELDPLLLEQHHPFGSRESNFILSFCANHHKIATLYPNFLKDWDDPC